MSATASRGEVCVRPKWVVRGDPLPERRAAFGRSRTPGEYRWCDGGRLCPRFGSRSGNFLSEWTEAARTCSVPCLERSPHAAKAICVRPKSPSHLLFLVRLILMPRHLPDLVGFGASRSFDNHARPFAFSN